MTPVSVMSGTLGDIFWDLAPWITYEPGYDLGCSIYVANPGDAEKEYTLMARLSRSGAVLSEEVLPVFGYTWFKVAPGDFVRRGALRFDESDSELAILLIERETEEVTDSVVTVLVTPSNASALPPSWPGAPGSSGSDWSSLLFMMVPVMMLGTVVAAGRPASDEKKTEPVATKGERKLLPEGRQEDAR